MLHAALFIVSAAFAAPNQVVLVAQRSTPAGMEQVAVVIKEQASKPMDATVNSAFLWEGVKNPPRGRYRLTGPNLARFHRAWWRALAAIPLTHESADSWPKTTPNASRTGGPHRLQVLVNGAEIKPASPLHSRITSFLSTLPSRATWDPVKP